MTATRVQKLSQNIPKLFWIQALRNLKAINVVVSLFYVSRDLTVSQIFLLGIFWSLGSLLFEIPSSYLADRWGRKKTMMLGTATMFLYWIILIFASGFFAIALVTIIYGIGSALLSGTDMALLYDTKRELGEHDETLTTFAQYSAVKHVLKIGGVIAGTIIGQNLLDWQFQIILLFDVIAMGIAFLISATLTEANHKMDLEKVEAGVFLDAVQLFRKTPGLFRAVANRELFFLSFFLLWVYFQQFMYIRGVSVTELGIGWAIMHVLAMGSKLSLKYFFPKYSIGKRININNWFMTASLLLLVILVYLPAPGLLIYIGFILFMVVKSITFVLFDEYLNRFSFSFNRATMLSLTNFIHPLFEIPLVVFGSILVARDDRFVYVLSFIVALFVITFLYVPNKEPRLL